MGNCLVKAGVSCEAEEGKPLVNSTVHDQAGDNCCKKRKKVRFNVQQDNAVTETTIMRPPRMKKGVRVKVVLTQTELKQILNRATIYNHHPPPSSPPTPSASFVDQISGQVALKCRRSRRPVMGKCRCSTWNPALHTIPEWDNHY